MKTTFKVWLICVGAFVGNLHAQQWDSVTYQRRIAMDRIQDVYIPRDTKDAMIELMKLTRAEGRENFMKASEDTIASKLHFSLGRWMLIHWGMEEGSRLSHYYKSMGISNMDDQIDYLIRCFYRHVLGQDLKEAELTQFYIEKRKKLWAEELKKRKIISETTTIRPPKK
ncbi:MAG: hypothetical protein M3Q56_11250 [Bacteroidota bacterium]|nr:hypothetical protein [Bacteroidota bacterium]